jgi:hypothetical protein
MSIDHAPLTYRIVERDPGRGGPQIDAIFAGESFPLIRATRPKDRWMIMAGPEVAAAAGGGLRFPPVMFAENEDAARTWVKLLADLYVKAAAR